MDPMKRPAPASRSSYGKACSLFKNYLHSIFISAELTTTPKKSSPRNSTTRQRMPCSYNKSLSRLTKLIILVQIVSTTSATFARTDSSLNPHVLKKFPEHYSPRFDTNTDIQSSKNNSTLLISSSHRYDRNDNTFKSPSMMSSWFEEEISHNKTSSTRSTSSSSPSFSKAARAIPDKAAKLHQRSILFSNEGLTRRSSRSAKLYITKSEHQKNNDSDYKCSLSGAHVSWRIFVLINSIHYDYTC